MARQTDGGTGAGEFGGGTEGVDCAVSGRDVRGEVLRGAPVVLEAPGGCVELDAAFITARSGERGVLEFFVGAFEVFQTS